tara:strand:+ start:363 stop:572 length:210 start_codon:yes stop_codon:yes gene_type:complete
MNDLDIKGWIALILVMVGGINLGLFGIFGGNFNGYILGDLVSRLVFIAIGVSAGYLGYLIYLLRFKKSV